MTVASKIAFSLSEPVEVFDDNVALPGVVVDLSGTAISLRDELSYENGAPGVLCSLVALGDEDAASRYAGFVMSRLSRLRDVNWPDRAGSVQGVVIAASVFRNAGAKWDALRRHGISSLHAKLEAGSLLIGSAAATKRPLPSFATYDAMRGFARDALLLLAYDDEISTIALNMICETLVTLLSDDGQPMPVWGPPFVGSGDGADLESHRNYGNAHGATGVARTLLLARDVRRAHGLSVETVDGTISAYCEWLMGFEELGTPPMFSSSRLVNSTGLLADVQSRPSWCYGSAGHQAMLLSAGVLLNRPDWIAHSEQQLLASADREGECEDFGLCHGSSGLMLTLELCGRAIESAALLARSQEMAQRLRAAHSDNEQFGYVYQPKGLSKGADVPGILNGAGGIMIALDLASRVLSAPSALRSLLTQSPWLTMDLVESPGSSYATSGAAS